MSGRLDSLCKIVCGSIQVPKVLAIENRRLGALHRLLQAGALTWVIFNIFQLRPWLQGSTPIANAFEIWAEDGDASLMDDATVNHCTDTSSYYYNYSAGWQYNPNSCMNLPEGEAYEKGAGVVYFSTFVQDRHMERHVGSCSSISCVGQKQAVVYQGVQMCECKRTEHFFVKNAELNMLHINHGYKVALDGSGTQFHSSTSRSGEVLREGGNNAGSHAGTILSIIQDYKGDPCNVGGRSEFTQKDTSVRGPLKDWLACGGIQLDSAFSSQGVTVSGNPLVGPPRFRITGAEVMLTMTFFNPSAREHPGVAKHDGVVCYIKVSTSPQWNSRTKVAHTQVPTTSDYRVGASNYRYRYSYGVSVKMRAHGTFMYLDYAALCTAIITQIVILSLPLKLVSFVALNCVGLASKIYQRAARQVLVIDAMFHGFCARMLCSVKAFGNLAPNGQLGFQELHDGMKEAFYDAKETAGGAEVDCALDEAELQHMAKIVFASMDTGATGQVTLAEFINAVARNETMQKGDMIKFFDVQRKVPVLEKLFSEGTFSAKVVPEPASEGTFSGKVVPEPAS